MTAITPFGIPLEFFLFGTTLFGVAVFHHHTLAVALTGLAAIVAYKLGFSGFHAGCACAPPMASSIVITRSARLMSAHPDRRVHRASADTRNRRR